MLVKVLGSGCVRCNNLERKVSKIIKDNSIDALVEKVTDLKEIMRYGILSTPGLVIDEKVVSYGSIPKDEQIIAWLKGGI